MVWKEIESWTDRIVKAVPYPRLRVWKNAFFHPTATLSNEEKRASATQSVTDLAVAGIAVGVIVGLAQLIGSLLGLRFIGVVGALVGILVGTIFLAVGWTIGNLILSALEWVVARILGGKGRYGTHAGLTAVGLSATALANLPFMAAAGLFTAVPLLACLGALFGIPEVLIGLYGIYVRYVAVKAAHRFEPWKAAVAVFVPIILVSVAIVAIVVLAVFTAVFGGLLGLALGGASGALPFVPRP